MNNPAVVPEVGMGVTKGVGSDRYAYTIIKVDNPRKIVVQQDRQRCTSGNQHNSEIQDWECQADPTGSVEFVTLRKNGRWVSMREAMNGNGFSLGHRSPHYDPHF